MNHKSNRQPNVVFVLTDDQGYGDLGCTGNPVLQTPNLDRMHDESVRLANFHVGPTSAPTRASLMTGHYANSTGVWHTIGGRSLLREDEWTLASALGEAGYDTAIFGKWHLGDAAPFRPQDRGFATSMVHGGGGVGQGPDYWGNDYFDDTYMVNGEPRQFTGYCTDVFFDGAIDYIKSRIDRPFFCCITTNAPHSPYNVADQYADRYRETEPEMRARFYGMLANIDENFARLRATLDELDLSDNTILIFMTDNGTSGGCDLDERGFVTAGHNAGLRGRKGSEYDGGHRVPAFIRWPAGGIAGGRDVDRITGSVDFMPTLLDLCEAPVRPDHSFHGRSVAPLLRDDAKDWPDRTLVTDSQRVPYPIKWKQSAVMTDRWRLVNGQELYDITRDREQRQDVAADHADLVERLREEYEQWWQIVSEQYDRIIAFHVGQSLGARTELMTHDLRNDTCEIAWHQRMVREGMSCEGFWNVDVRKAGRYRVELRRWPREAGHAMGDGIEGDDVVWSRQHIHRNNWHNYTGGKALAIRAAMLQVGQAQWQQDVDPASPCATFEVDLPEGTTELRAMFTGEADLRLTAYYVSLERIG